MTIETRLRRLLEEISDYPQIAATISLDDNVIDKCELDSLDAVELTMAIEDEFTTEIPDEDTDNITTLRQMVAWLVKEGFSDSDIGSDWATPVRLPFSYEPDWDPADTEPIQINDDINDYVVVFPNATVVSGYDANLYDDLDIAREFASILVNRGIEATVYGLVKV